MESIQFREGNCWNKFYPHTAKGVYLEVSSVLLDKIPFQKGIGVLES